MTIEQELMRLMKQTHALARRRPPDGEGCQGRQRGAGHILELLTREPGISQQQIADTLGIRPQSASEAIALLAERGYVRRECSPEDRRVTLIHLTGAGAAHAQELAEERRAHAIRFFSVLTEEEKETLRALLTRITTEKERDGR